MGKLRQTALILGEGPTEFFYFKSLCDVFKRLTIKPDYPKHTSIKELESKIAEGIELGYNHIFCIIDMDYVMHGSYNWTSAANHNKETWATAVDRELVSKFATEFMHLYNAEKIIL